MHAGLLTSLDGGGLASAPFRTERLVGRVFFSAMQTPTTEILSLVELVAREVGASLNQWEAERQQRRLAIAEERIRLARDLHDGVLQSLTAVRLELQTVASHAEAVPPDETRNRLLAMERALALEQRELRRFIEGLKPMARSGASGTPLERQLDDLQQRLTTQWKVPVTIRMHDLPAVLPSSILDAVPRVVQEAVVNAMKHGGPSRVSVDVTGGPDALSITTVDDGRGFPFRGRYDHETLARTGSGPVSLRERVASLGGRLEIDSSDAGARVHVHLPVRSRPV